MNGTWTRRCATLTSHFEIVGRIGAFPSARVWTEPQNHQWSLKCTLLGLWKLVWVLLWINKAVPGRDPSTKYTTTWFCSSKCHKIGFPTWFLKTNWSFFRPFLTFFFLKGEKMHLGPREGHKKDNQWRGITAQFTPTGERTVSIRTGHSPVPLNSEGKETGPLFR